MALQTGPRSGVQVESLFSLINSAQNDVVNKMNTIKNNKSSVSVGDMFEMQMLMNKMSQMSEMTTNVVAALNQVAKTMSQNVRG